MKSKNFTIMSLFEMIPGKFHSTGELEAGAVPLISCGEENNGLIGHYDIPVEKTHERALTVSFNGFPLTTSFHPYRFGAKDDVAVLVPLKPLSDGTLLYIAALLNRMKWRYSYGRKCYREKLRNVLVRLPVVATTGKIDEAYTDALLSDAHKRVKAAAKRSVEALLKRR